MPDRHALRKLVTHTPGLEHVTDGGLPAGRSTLVSGTAGSAKTVLAAQFLIAGITHAGEAGVFVTFEELGQRSSQLRITSGNADLDRMCGGGFFRDSVVMISGATGAGKTLIATEFMAGGAMNGERCLLFAFEESRAQLHRNAAGWGVDYERMERDGLLEIICVYPESNGLEDHLIRMKQAIERFAPARVAVDSLSALERIATHTGFREFVIALISFIKHEEIAGLLTATTPELFGGTSVTEAHISTITDSIVLLRYVEMPGEMRRGLTVLKMRGSHHDKEIREFTIDASGMHIGEPLRGVSGIFTGQARERRGANAQ